MDNSIDSKGKREKETFSFSKEIDGVTKTVRGEECENGWIITIDKQWYEKNPLNDSKEYRSGTWKYISKDNPLNKMKEGNADGKTGEENDMANMFSDIVNSSGMLLVD